MKTSEERISENLQDQQKNKTKHGERLKVCIVSMSTYTHRFLIYRYLHAFTEKENEGERNSKENWKFAFHTGTLVFISPSALRYTYNKLEDLVGNGAEADI
jgi:hypothetical protein